MEKITTLSNKSKEEDISIEELHQENKQNHDVADTLIFDETLKEIKQTLSNLEKNDPLKEEVNIIKDNNILREDGNIEKNYTNLNQPFLLSNELNEETFNAIKEHKIDKDLLSQEELIVFEENEKKKKKNTFGFYAYLISIIIIFFTIYVILNVSKILIISKYPVTEPYINYFYEIIEILKITILSLLDFIKIKI